MACNLKKPKFTDMKNVKEIVTLYDLMVVQLKSLYNAEMQWSEAMETVTERIHSTELKNLFRKDGLAAARHAKKLEVILKESGAELLAKRNIVVRDLLREINELQDSSADPEVLNAGLIVIHQCMNHYKIAKYGTVASYARLMQQERVAGILHEILEEEKAQDEELTRLAEEKINEKAKTALVL